MKNKLKILITILLAVAVIAGVIAIFSSSFSSSGSSGSLGNGSSNNSSATSCEHSYDSVVYLTDCTEGGKSLLICKNCAHVVEQEILPQEHLFQDVTAKEPTCTEAGYIAGQKCARCEYSTIDEVIPALGHDILTLPDKAATCTEAGYANYKYCSRCDYQTKDELTITEHTYTNHSCAVCGAVELFEFTIDGVTYFYEYDMTFGEWCDSQYNVDSYYVSSTTQIKKFGSNDLCVGYIRNGYTYMVTRDAVIRNAEPTLILRVV